MNLASNPYQFNGLQYIADIVFCITVFFFVFFTFISIVRYSLWPNKIRQTFEHPSQSLTLAMYPLTISMICNLWNARCVPSWGPWAQTFVFVLWWIDVVLSVAISLYIPFLLYVYLFFIPDIFRLLTLLLQYDGTSSGIDTYDRRMAAPRRRSRSLCR